MLKIMSSIALFLALISCGKDKTIKNNAVIRENSSHTPNDTSGLRKVDLNDKKYGDARSYLKDTITKHGWKIEYLVKSDSTKYSDLYLKVSKEGLHSVFVAKNVLEYRRYFIPTYKSENGSNIFFTHGCATDCRAILSF